MLSACWRYGIQLPSDLSSTVCLLPNVADVRPTSGSSPEFCLVAFASREKECGL